MIDTNHCHNYGLSVIDAYNQRRIHGIIKDAYSIQHTEQICSVFAAYRFGKPEIMENTFDFFKELRLDFYENEIDPF